MSIIIHHFLEAGLSKVNPKNSVLLYWFLTYNSMVGLLIMVVTATNREQLWGLYDLVSFAPLDIVTTICRFDFPGFNGRSLGSHALVGFVVFICARLLRKSIFKSGMPNIESIPFGVDSFAKLGILAFLACSMTDSLAQSLLGFDTPDRYRINGELPYFALSNANLGQGIKGGATVVFLALLLVLTFRWTSLGNRQRRQEVVLGRIYRKLGVESDREFTSTSARQIGAKRLNRMWLSANLLRPESILVLGSLPVISIGISDGMPWYNVLLGYLIISSTYAALRLLTNVLTLGLIIVLMMIPVLGWVVLAGMILMRLDWFMRNAAACWAIVFMLAATIGCGCLPIGRELRIAIPLLVGVVALSFVYLSGKSTLEFIDAMMSLPASIVLLGIAVAHFIIDIAGDHGGHAHASDGSKHHLAESKYNSGPKIEYVKAHVRTSPDGLKQNNLSYHGPGKIGPSGKYVSVKGYVRSAESGPATYPTQVQDSFVGTTYVVTSGGDASSATDLLAAARFEIARRHGATSCSLRQGHESAIDVMARKGIWRDLRYALHMSMAIFFDEWSQFFRGMKFNGEAQISNFKAFWGRIMDSGDISGTAAERTSQILWTCARLSTLGSR